MSKNDRFADAVLKLVLAIPGHPPRLNPLKMDGVLFKIEGRPFRSRGPPGSILGAKIKTKRRPEAYKVN